MTAQHELESSKDYRAIEAFPEGFSLSERVLDPIAKVTLEDGSYRVRIGANLRKAGVLRFISAISISHNWILDGNRIKPLPVDIPTFARDLLLGVDPDKLQFPDVIRISSSRPELLTVEIDETVFQTGNIRSLDQRLDQKVSGLHATLFPYQENGIAWMKETLDRTNGLILADEMGLGKTIQIIALFLLKRPCNEHPALIVCPTSLIVNWCRELTKFAPSISYLVHRGSDRTGYYKDLMRSEVVITTYDTLTNDISAMVGVDWLYLICDEAQAAKNPESRRRQALARIPRVNTIPMTGTPVETSLMDLWSLADLAIPGMLGLKENFLSIYPNSEQGARDLSRITDPIIIKRQVKDVAADLPERTNIDQAVDMSRAESLEYERVRQKVINEYGPAGHLVAVGQLSLFAAHPWLRMRDANDPDWENRVEMMQDEAYPLITPKMELCLSILREAFFTNKKVLIFACYNHCGELIKRAADKLNFPSAYWNLINGSTPQSDRQNIVDEFTLTKGPGVLVLNPKAAGSGLNITAATIVIHYTQNWNPAFEMQASARAHRRGQKHPVTVYKLFYQDTVDETMIERSAWRSELGGHAVPVSTRENKDLRTAMNLSPLKSK
jgi:SNF2 family DNA or RNA helicase